MDKKNQNQNKSQASSDGKNGKLTAIVVGAVIIVIIVAIGACLFLNKTLNKSKADTVTPVGGSTQNQISQTTNEEIYFGKGSQGKYSLVNVQTGNVQDFIPSGYVLLNQTDYQTFPTFLILQKDNDLYSYSVENKIVSSIFGSFNDLKLKKNEQARVYPSITEKDKFIIQIDTLDLSQISEYDGSSPVLSTRTYSFDAAINKVAAITNVKLDGCFAYDSKNQRFFVWPCGEGIGSAAPLSISDLNGNIKNQIITAKDFGMNNDNLIHIEFKNGLFLALRNDDNIKVIVLNPALENLSKEIYTATAQVNSQISDLYAYSMAIDRSANTLIIGGSDYILLLRFDENKQITQSAYIPDREIYANFIFPNEGKLYYQAKDNIRVIDLNSWKIDKSIPSVGSFQEITLFAF